MNSKNAAKVVVSDLVQRMADARADAHPEHWIEGEDESLRRTIVSAMNQHGWLNGVPGILPHVLKMLQAGEIAAFATFNDLPPADVAVVIASPGDWWVSERDAAKVVSSLSAGLTPNTEADGLSDEYEAAWLDATYNAQMWWDLSSVSAEEASALLCGADPMKKVGDLSHLSTPGEPSGSDYGSMSRWFADVALDRIPRTLRDWLEVAEKRGLKRHSWIDEWMTAAAVAREQVSRPMAGESVDANRMETLDSAKISAGEAPPDFSMLASPAELIKAFGPFTGMTTEWFKSLKDTPALLSAKRVQGRPGKHSLVPFFCPFAVMQWLADPKRKKGRPMSAETAWRMLQAHFPKVYASREHLDPRG